MAVQRSPKPLMRVRFLSPLPKSYKCVDIFRRFLFVELDYDIIYLDNRIDERKYMMPLEVGNLINSFVERSKDILKENLVGVYLHGSLAMGCFNPQRR